MRHLIVATSFLLLIISMSSQAAGQAQPCTLKLSQAPSVRGVKLDMTVDQLFFLFPGSSDNPDIKQRLGGAEGYPSFGETAFQISPSNYPAGDRFVGIEGYIIRSFDRRVVGVDIHYYNFPKGARWRNVDDLVQRFADSFHLPGPKDWESNGDSSRILQCDGFRTVVNATGDSSSISFYNPGWVQTKKDRSTAFEDQKRREFKP